MKGYLVAASKGHVVDNPVQRGGVCSPEVVQADQRCVLRPVGDVLQLQGPDTATSDISAPLGTAAYSTVGATTEYGCKYGGSTVGLSVPRARNFVARRRELRRANRVLNNEVKRLQGRSHSGHDLRGHSHEIPVRIS